MHRAGAGHAERPDCATHCATVLPKAAVQVKQCLLLLVFFADFLLSVFIFPNCICNRGCQPSDSNLDSGTGTGGRTECAIYDAVAQTPKTHRRYPLIV